MNNKKSKNSVKPQFEYSVRIVPDASGNRIRQRVKAGLLSPKEAINELKQFSFVSESILKWLQKRSY
jgi:hypothetical protein